MSENTAIDVDSILDGTLDDIADLPAFKTFPAGSHQVIISWEVKKVGENQCAELKLKAVETLELSDPSDIAPAAGDETTILYMLNNDFGLGKWKEVLKPLAEHTGKVKPSEIMAESNGLECVVTTKVRKGKKERADETYTDIFKLAVI